MSDSPPSSSDAVAAESGTPASTPKKATPRTPAQKKPAASKKPAAKKPVTASATAGKRPTAAKRPAVKKTTTAPRVTKKPAATAAKPAAEALITAPPIMEPIDFDTLTIATTYDNISFDEPEAESAHDAAAPAAVVTGGDSDEAFDDAADEASDAASAEQTPAVLARGLVKRFGGFTAVAGINLTVPAGSFYGVVGPNGAGKTTTLSILSGFLKADEGTVQIAGYDQATDLKSAKSVMGILPDRLRTFDRLTARQLLRYYGLLRGLSPKVIDQRTADLARAFDLTSSLGRVVSDFSAGMTKKLMLAGAMIHSPRVLVLDEPFEAVDPVASSVILDILRTYVDHGGTVILSSHGMDLVERVCSRIAVIVGGELLAEGTVEEISAGQSLEARFIELAGGSAEVEGLEWLHTFSD